MRDVNRIKPFCDELAELWARYPDLRFGQMMHNIFLYIEREIGRDVFYFEEEELMEVIRHQLRKIGD